MAHSLPLSHAELHARLSLSQASHQSTKNELATTRANLSTTQADLCTTKNDLATTQKDLSTTRTKLSATKTELSTTKSDLGTTQAALAATQAKLALAEQEAQNLREWYDELQRSNITQGGGGFGLKTNEGVSMPKYKGRCPRELPGVECGEDECPWLHQVQARGFSKRVIMGLPHDRAEAKRKMKKKKEEEGDSWAGI